MLCVDEERCTGCGLCVEVCPSAAISLRDGMARIEQTLCRECEACLPACPNGAILALREPTEARKLTPIGVPETTPASARPITRAPWLSGAWSWVSGALAFFGRESVPRTKALLGERGQRQPRPESSSRAHAVSGRMNRRWLGRGRRARHRRRGRW